MPFMKGISPVRRTLEYLSSSKLKLKPFVRIFAVHYNYQQKNSEGAKEFVHWNLSQLKYNNPDVQVITFKEMTPTPFIRVFFNSGKDILMDIDRQDRETIHARVTELLCLDEEHQKESKDQQKDEFTSHPANFGPGCRRHCLCEIPGQVPCPAVVPLPYHMRGKYRFGFAELDDSKYL